MLQFLNKRSSLTFFIFLTLGMTNASGQGEQTAPLLEILNTIEKRYDVSFNYAVEDVRGINITLQKAPTSLDDAIYLLRSVTGLTYNRIGDRIITITPLSPSEICGTLVHPYYGTPVKDVLITSGTAMVRSDAQGYFILRISDVDAPITMTKAGFETIRLGFNDFNTKSCLTIPITSARLELDDVLLTGYLVKGLDKTEQGAIKIDFDRFTLLPGLIESDVLQTTQALPGILSTNETVSNISIRGGANDQNLILWDDIKMYQTGHFFGLISAFNPQITQEALVVKNGTPVKYTDGISGSILMRTDDEVNQKTNGNIALNFLSAEGFIDLPTGKNSSLQVAARHSLSDYLRTPTYANYFDRISQDTEVENNDNNTLNSDQNFSFYDTSLRWLYNINPKDQIRINAMVLGNELLFDESALLNNVPRTRTSSLTQNSIAAGIDYKHFWEDKSTTSLHLYETDYTLRARNVNVLDEQRFLQENTVSESSVKLIHEKPITDRLTLLGGYQFLETGITNLDDVDLPRFRRKITRVLREHAAFTQVDYRTLSRKLNLTLGLRYTYIDKLGTSLFEPRLSLRQKLGESLTIEAQGELKHQSTSQIINFQNDFLGIEKRRWRLANNEDIPVMKSKQASLGVTYAKHGWMTDATVYFKSVDGITAQSQGFETKYEFEKAIGSYEVYGIDFLIRKRIGDLISWVSYSVMDNTYTFDTLEEKSFRSNYDITHAFTLGTTYAYNRLKISAGLTYRSGKPTTQPDANDPVVAGEVNFRAVNSSRLTSYKRMDLSVLYTVLKQEKTNLELGVSLWNVTNQNNTIADFFRVSATNTITAFSQQSLGTTVNGVLRLRFL